MAGYASLTHPTSFKSLMFEVEEAGCIGDDLLARSRGPVTSVMPAKAGIQYAEVSRLYLVGAVEYWIIRFRG
jgi:hypothetical protein